MKTAVEWLIQELFNNGYFPYGVPEDLVKKAKEMEKQKIMDAWHNGRINESNFFNDHTGTIIRANSAEQYYNETFKSE